MDHVDLASHMLAKALPGKLYSMMVSDIESPHMFPACMAKVLRPSIADVLSYICIYMPIDVQQSASFPFEEPYEAAHDWARILSGCIHVEDLTLRLRGNKSR